MFSDGLPRRSFFAWVFGALGGVMVRKPNGGTDIKQADFKKIKISCGDLEVNSPDGLGKSTSVIIDGQVVAAKSIHLHCDVRGAWSAMIEYYPCLGFYGQKK